jgi:hypothetical protein
MCPSSQNNERSFIFTFDSLWEPIPKRLTAWHTGINRINPNTAKFIERTKVEKIELLLEKLEKLEQPDTIRNRGGTGRQPQTVCSHQTANDSHLPPKKRQKNRETALRNVARAPEKATERANIAAKSALAVDLLNALATPIGPIHKGDPLKVLFADDGRWYGGTVTRLAADGVVVSYPSSDSWHACVEHLPLSGLVPSRVKHGTAGPPAGLVLPAGSHRKKRSRQKASDRVVPAQCQQAVAGPSREAVSTSKAEGAYENAAAPGEQKQKETPGGAEKVQNKEGRIWHVGARCDAQDRHGSPWTVARIVEAGGSRVKVHFRGWCALAKPAPQACTVLQSGVQAEMGVLQVVPVGRVDGVGLRSVRRPPHRHRPRTARRVASRSPPFAGRLLHSTVPHGCDDAAVAPAGWRRTTRGRGSGPGPRPRRRIMPHWRRLRRTRAVGTGAPRRGRFWTLRFGHQRRG